MYVEARVNPGVTLQMIFPLFLVRTASLAGLKHTDLAACAGQSAPGIHLVLK